MTDIDVHYDPISLHSDPTTVNVHADPATVNIVGLDNTHNTITLETPKPLQSEIKTTLLIPEKIRTESSADLDIKPLALDQCLKIQLGPLPPTCVRQPYQQHFGITLFGVEIFGFNLAGESQLIVDNLPTKPQIVWGGEQAFAKQSHAPIMPASNRDFARPSQVRTDAQAEPGGGLRIRLGR